MSVDVELCTVVEVLRLRRALPDAWFRTENDAIWARVVDEDADLRTDGHASELSEDADDLAPSSRSGRSSWTSPSAASRTGSPAWWATTTA